MFATKETDPTRQAPSQPPPSRELPLDRAPLDETPFDQTPFERVPLDGVPFDGVSLDEVSLDEVPLDEVPLDEVPLDEVPFDGVPFDGVPLDEVPLDEVPLDEVPFDGVPFDGVPFDGVPFDGVPLDEVPLDEVPLERIEVELIGWAGRLAAATARWLTWLAAYDRREGWGQWGCRSCAHWLSWKCGMSLRTGRDHVRVARSLESRPAVAMAFERGELSFSKVRALTRLAEPVDDDAMVDLARTATASQLDRLIAGCQQALTTGPESDELTTGWMTRSYRSQGRADGMVAITLLVTPDDAERIERAVEQRTDHLVAEATAGTAGTGTAGTGDTADNAPGSVQEWVKERGGWSSVRADAAVELLTGLGDREDPDPAELAIEVDITALASGDGSGGHSSTAGHWLSHEVIRRYGCDGIARVIATDGDHQPLGVGRRQRIVPRWLRRRLERRDHHHCQFPGCDTTRRLHAHHIVHWADGGPTTLENLLLLCSFHHHVIHDRDWAISGTAPDHQITTPDGMPTTVPCLTGDPTTVANLDIGDPASLTASWAGERLDLAFAVEALIDHLKGTP